MARKIFEVNDVLPATTQLKVTWEINDYLANRSGYITTTNDYLWIYFDLEYGAFEDGWIKVNNQLVTYLSIPGPYEIIINTSSWNLSRRTVTHDTTDDVMLFYWEDLNAPTGYTITFNSNGGSSVSDITEATKLPTSLPTPTKSGYKFVAWYYESNFQTRAKAGDTIEANTTLYAKWHNLGTLFTGIANAIRSKDGISGNIRDLDFDDRIRAIEPAKEEETKTVTPNFSSGNVDVTPTTDKVLSQVTINKDSNLIADNIKKDITVHGITGTLQPAKEEETKTVTPNFSSGNVDVTPTSGKVMTKVTINKDSNLVASNIKKDITVHGITGTLESGGGGYTVTFTNDTFNGYSYTNGGIHYSFDNGVTYHPITTIRNVITNSWEIVPAKLMGVTQIRFKIVAKDVYKLWASVGSVLTPSRQSGNWSAESSNITLSSNVTYGLEWWED